MADTPPDDETGPDEPGEDLLGPGIDVIAIQEEMEQSFLDYSMSVIVSRALPDVRDGLKPVHRRILWAMNEGGLRPDRSHVKCATVVGDVLGKYHPHGDTSVYDALVRLGQDFSVRHRLIDPHGNFGSPSDPPAAYRYTECRLQPLAMELLADIDEDTVDFTPNFDGRHEEPDVLPSRYPNLLVNGSQGIAVGMATNIPPHNLGEVSDAVLHLIENPEATPDDLMEFVKGPDFPTGGQIMGRQGILDAYRTGRGSIKIRGDAEIVEGARSDQIVVTAIPYQTSVEQIEQKSAELVNKGELEGIREIRNESAKGKTRLVFELKKDAPALVILNNLYKHSPLQTNFSVNMVALVDGVPRTLNLRDALVAYLDHQAEVIRRRSEFRLAKALARAHIVEGLIKAIDMIDAIIALIRASADRAEARTGLMAEPFEFSEEQAVHILDMQLGRLTRLGRSELESELAELRETITELEAILGSRERLMAVISEELTEVRDQYANERRSVITYDVGDLDIEDLIDDEELVVTLSHRGYVKTVPAGAFKTQGRGGRGVAGVKLKDEDFVTQVITTTAHAYLLFFSNRGKVYRLKAHELPMKDRTARGTAMVNLLPLMNDEHIQAIIDTRDYETSRFLFFATRLGQVKKTKFTEYDSSRRDGLIAIKLKDDDELVRVIQTTGDDDVFIVSAKGQTIRFNEDLVRPMGRSAGGVRGLKLKEGDEVVSCAPGRDGLDLLLITDAGYGKRTKLDKFPTKGRGTMGVKGFKLTAKKGTVTQARMVSIDDELILISSSGTLIRTPVKEISSQGRDAGGVRVMNLDDGETVAAVAPVFQDDADD
jgi:DNA gyrase subunit A